MFDLHQHVKEIEQSIKNIKSKRKERLKYELTTLQNELETQNRLFQQKKSKVNQLLGERKKLESELKKLMENETKELAANDSTTQLKRKLLLENSGCDEEIRDLTQKLEQLNETKKNLLENLATRENERSSFENQYEKELVQYSHGEAKIAELTSATKQFHERITNVQTTLLYCLTELSKPVDVFSQGAGGQKTPRNS